MRKEKLRKFEFVAIGLVVLMMFVCVFSARAFASFAGDIYIRADGSVDPGNAPITTADNVTYTLTADVSGKLTIQRDSIVFDGAGHTFTGSGSEYGITLDGRSNVTVKDTTVENFYGTGIGIYLNSSSGNTLSGNNAANNWAGIFLDHYSFGNTVSGNNVANSAYGISCYTSDYNTLSGNTATANYNAGICLEDSSNNVVSGNNVTASNSGGGIWLESASNNVLSGNNVANSRAGIVLNNPCSNNTLSDNNVAANWLYGIELYVSPSNTLSGNNITNNNYGVLLSSSSGNTFFHNRLVNNAHQVSSDGNPNTWDNGYPSGGNYWSNYAGTDVYSGPGQNVPGSDRIGDASYVIDSNNVDHYPLYASTFTPQQLVITVLPSNGGSTDPLPGDYYAYASSVIVSATPNAGYQLSHWLLDGSGVGAANPITVTMDTNHTLQAVFNYTGDIYIRADGSVDPLNAPVVTSDNVTYTLTADVLGTLTIQRDNIVFDGAGYTFTGDGSGYGITVSARSDVTVKDTTMENFTLGIYLDSSSGNTLSGNNVANSQFGIYLDSSYNNALSGNNLANNGYGIYLIYSSNNSIGGNNMTNDDLGIWLYSSSNNSVSGNNITNNGYGLYLAYSSDNNNVSGNTITASTWLGIWLKSSSSNTLSSNNVTANGWDGIVLDSSANNTLSGNTLTNNAYGISLVGSSDSNTLSGNNAANNQYGIYLDSSSGNTLSSNNVTANSPYGIYLDSSSGNLIFHNSFVNNAQQVSSDGSPNVWDNGYPSGGNYWSDYAGTDVYSGPGQNVPGSDGIGDTPYVIDSNNVDNYPFYSLTPLPQYALAITISGSGITYPAAGKYTYEEVVNVTVTALPNIGYQFDHWMLDSVGTGTSPSITVTMSGNHTLEAVFAPFSRTIYIRADGSIDPWNAPVATSDNVTYTLTADVSSTLTIERDNIVFDGAGHTFTGDWSSRNGMTISGRSNVTVRNTTMENFNFGIYIESSSGSILSDNTLANNGGGIELMGSAGNTLSNNNVADNYYGIYLCLSSNNVLSDNNIADNYFGIDFANSPDNVLSGNNIANGKWGVDFANSPDNVLSGNNVTSNSNYGIYLEYSSNNTLSGNNVTANGGDGIALYWSSGNTFFHNRFVNNGVQVLSDGSPNVWDNGYPSGGNYWSDYTGTDIYRGPGQNAPGSDGIGDTPYVTDGSNVDHYPLYALTPLPQYALAVTVSGSGTTYPAGGDYTYNEGSNVTVTAYPGMGYQFDHWLIDGDPTSPINPCTITMDANHAIEAFFIPSQYKVSFAQTGSGVNPTVSYSIDGGSVVVETVPFDVWVDSGSSIAYTYTMTVPGGTGIQYVFISLAPTSPQTVTGPLAVTGFYKTRYYLTVTSPHDSPTPLSGWFDSSSNITASVTSPMSGGSGIRYRCTGWSGTGSVSSSGSATSVTFTIGAPSTIAWNWRTQYYLTLNSAHDTPSGAGWYDARVTAYFSVTSPVSGGSGVRYVCTGYTGYASGSGNSGSIVMNGPKTVTFTWKTQYYLTVVSAYDTPLGAGWYDSGATAHFSVSSPVAGGSGVRYVCTSYTGSKSGSGVSGSITMNAPRSVTFTWKTQYYLTLNSAHDTPLGAGWYDAGTVARFSVTSPVPGPHGIRYVCTGYTGDASGSGTSGSIVMNGPKTVTFTWKP